MSYRGLRSHCQWISTLHEETILTPSYFKVLEYYFISERYSDLMASTLGQLALTDFQQEKRVKCGIENQESNRDATSQLYFWAKYRRCAPNEASLRCLVEHYCLGDHRSRCWELRSADYPCRVETKAACAAKANKGVYMYWAAKRKESHVILFQAGPGCFFVNETRFWSTIQF